MFVSVLFCIKKFPMKVFYTIIGNVWVLCFEEYNMFKCAVPLFAQ